MRDVAAANARIRELEAACGRLMREASQAVEASEREMIRRMEVERRLHDLLAIIHGDGGHYVQEHGEAKAVEDAKAAWWERSVELDSLRGQERREDP